MRKAIPPARRRIVRCIGVAVALMVSVALVPAAAQAGWYNVRAHVEGAGRVVEREVNQACQSPLTTRSFTEGAMCKFAFGTSALGYGRKLEASTIRDGWRFVGWSGRCNRIDGASCYIDVPGGWWSEDVDVTARFQDTKRPDTSILSGPLGVVASRSANFFFTSDEAGYEGAHYECRLDGGGWFPCSSGHGFTNLTDGVHTFEVRAIDTSGNVDSSPAMRTWTVDTTGPGAHIIAGPSGIVRSSTARFDFTAGDAMTVQCSLDGGPWVTCQSPTSHQYTGISEGTHTFRVRGLDAVGNANGAIGTQQWTVDTIPPDTVIDGGPENGTSTTSTQATFAFRTAGPEGDVDFECKLDGGGFGPCSGPGAQANLTNLGVGAHTFSVRATDEAGNPDPTPASRTWTVVAPPNLDVDGDGFQRKPEGPDCDDRNAAVHPGARDVPENGVDENCDGVDAVNLDRDGDGYQRRPSGPDCNDAAASIHPGAVDVPENGVDEDCDGVDRRYEPLGADVRATWKYAGAKTKVIRLVAIKVPGGTKVTMLCKGDRKACPRRKSTLTVERDTPEVAIRSALRKPLRQYARLIVDLSRPGMKGLRVIYKMRKGRAPSRVDRCLSPVTGRPEDC